MPSGLRAGHPAGTEVLPGQRGTFREQAPTSQLCVWLQSCSLPCRHHYSLGRGQGRNLFGILWVFSPFL